MPFEDDILEFLIFCSFQVYKSVEREKNDFFWWPFEGGTDMHQKIQPDGQAGRCRLAGNSVGHWENSIFSSPTLFYMCKEWNIKKWGMSSSTAISNH